MNAVVIWPASVAIVWIGAVALSEGWGRDRPSAPGEARGRMPEALWGLRLVLAPMAALWPLLLFFAISGRAVVSTLIVLALLLALAVAQQVKSKVLREPLVFSDYAHIVQVFTHPGLYVPFAGTWRVVGLLLVLALLATAAFVLEPAYATGNQRAPFWARLGCGAAGLAGILIWPLSIRRYFRSRHLDRIGSWNAPERLLTRYGLIGSWLLQYAAASDERRLHRIRSYRPAAASALRFPENSPHIVLVQAESFFDTRRLFRGSDDLPAAVRLANFEAACARATRWGRFDVSAWGANSLRTEFAVLSMMPERELGVHRFHPYLSAAREPLWTVPRHLRELGYKTVCLHPFSKRFFGRHRVFANLGFDEFLDIGAFAGAPRCGRHVCDRAIAEKLAGLMPRDAGEQPVFAFIITMEAHGPWSGQPEATLSPYLPAPLRRDEVAQYLAHIQHTDRMIGDIATLPSRLGREMVLGLYGDHLPSFLESDGLAGFDETATDYVIWRGNGSPRSPRNARLQPEQFCAELLAAAGLMDDRAATSARGADIGLDQTAPSEQI